MIMGMNGILAVAVIASILILGALGFTQEAEAASFTATKSGNWDDAATWGDAVPPTSIASTDTVTIPSEFTVTIPSLVTITNSGTIDNFGDITNFGGTIENFDITIVIT